MAYKDPAKLKEWVRVNRVRLRAYHNAWEKKARAESRIDDNTPAKQAAKRRYKIKHPDKIRVASSKRYVDRREHILGVNRKYQRTNPLAKQYKKMRADTGADAGTFRRNARGWYYTNKLQKKLDKSSKEMGIYD